MAAPAPTGKVTSIRLAEPADAPRVAELMEQLGYATTPATVELRLRAVLRDDAHAVFVAVDEAGLAGCIHGIVVPILESDLTLQVFALVVDGARRRAGIGRQLTAAIEGWGRERGCTIVSLRCNARRVEAHQFWSAVGYTNTKTQFAFRKPLDS